MESTKFEPEIRNYQYRAFLEVTLANHKDYETWLYSNYIQTVFWENAIDTIHYDFEGPTILGACELLDYKKIDNPYKNKIFHSSIEEAIKKNGTVYLFVDEYYIPNRKSYEKNHYVHDALIVSYDEIKRVYSILGYDETYHFKKVSVTYDDVEKAFVNNQNRDKLYILAARDRKYELDLKKMRAMLIDFVKGYDSRKHWEMYVDFDNADFDKQFYDVRRNSMATYGIKTYVKYKEYLLNCMNSNMKNDFRISYTIFEHCKIMRKRIEFLIRKEVINCDMKYVLEGAIEIENDAIAILNLSMKSIFLEDRSKIYKKMINKIDGLEKKENKLIEDLIIVLDANIVNLK